MNLSWCRQVCFAEERRLCAWEALWPLVCSSQPKFTSLSGGPSYSFGKPEGVARTAWKAREFGLVPPRPSVGVCPLRKRGAFANDIARLPDTLENRIFSLSEKVLHRRGKSCASARKLPRSFQHEWDGQRPTDKPSAGFLVIHPMC